MIGVVQSVVGDGREGRPEGDCLRACFASIFEVSLFEVPDLSTNWIGASFDWLRRRGFVAENELWSQASESPVPTGYRWPAGWWIADVSSGLFPGCRHAVVMRGYYTVDGSDAMNTVAWDPSPTTRTAPYVFYGATWFSALDPAAMRKVRP